MCERCKELDAKITHYQEMSKMILDELTLNGIAVLIENAERKKRALHPDQR
jgi:hypothetical protein